MLENRFKHYETYSDDELLAERERVKEELESDKATADDPSTSSEQISELLSSDIPFEEDALEAINHLLRDRGIEPSRTR